MTVKEVFDLRKQGRIEEAYDAIRPMYAQHKGHYTTLCMYLTARDIFNIRLHEGRTDEARKILEALKRLVPSLDDKDGYVARFMQFAEQRLVQFEESKRDCGTDPVSRDTAGTRPCPNCPEEPVELNPAQQSVLDAIHEHPGLRIPALSETTGIPAQTLERHIAALTALHLIEHRGSKKTGGYYAK